MEGHWWGGQKSKRNRSPQKGILFRQLYLCHPSLPTRLDQLKAPKRFTVWPQGGGGWMRWLCQLGGSRPPAKGLSWLEDSAGCFQKGGLKAHLLHQQPPEGLHQGFLGGQVQDTGGEPGWWVCRLLAVQMSGLYWGSFCEGGESLAVGGFGGNFYGLICRARWSLVLEAPYFVLAGFQTKKRSHTQRRGRWKQARKLQATIEGCNPKLWITHWLTDSLADGGKV